MENIEDVFRTQLQEFSLNRDPNVKNMLFTFDITQPYDGVELDVLDILHRKLFDFELEHVSTTWKDDMKKGRYIQYVFKLEGIRPEIPTAKRGW
jgi:hypothetical protein